MVSDAKKIAFDCPRSIRSIASIAVLALGIIVSAPRSALADEGGVSFWLPGFFGSLAAAPQQPGWSLTSIYYHTSVSAGADVARAREFEIGRIPITATANVSASLDARADLALALPAYTVATPVFGGQLTVGALEYMAARAPPWRGQLQARWRPRWAHSHSRASTPSATPWTASEMSCR